MTLQLRKVRLEINSETSAEKIPGKQHSSGLYSDALKKAISVPSACTSDTNPPNNEWKPVHRKKRTNARAQIVGSNKNSELKTVPKCVELHVYRLHPDITETDLKGVLLPKFPEVSCEQLVGKNIKQYSSFKVTLYESNFQTAMDPSVWPHGACINKFFRLRRRDLPKD